jgi:hypothetical protein
MRYARSQEQFPKRKQVSIVISNGEEYKKPKQPEEEDASSRNQKIWLLTTGDWLLALCSGRVGPDRRDGGYRSGIVEYPLLVDDVASATE